MANRCDYCESLDVREISPAFWFGGKHYSAGLVCEDCFTPMDDGPCWDDLPMPATNKDLELAW